MLNNWTDLVLIPGMNSRDPGVVSLHILDLYCVHMMGSVVNHNQAHKIEVQYIMAGCRFLCQHVDVGINHPI
jgi:hypothetical protein